MSTKNPLYVTQPALPPLAEFTPYLERIWETKTLTNCGPFHQQLELELCSHLGVNNVSLFTNATIALITALQAMRITGDVITTPYSFVATAHSLLWNGIRPIFVDIDPNTLNIDPRKIEAAITPQTTAILAVHCYGRPCDVEAIQRIADIYNLKVIYDAAHAFGVTLNGRSILAHGDLSVVSFHATKVFNTFEGGAIISPNEKTKQRIDNLKNFGFVDEVTVVAPGINGKMSEINAAFGLVQLKHIDAARASRKKIDSFYREALKNIKGIDCLNHDAPDCSNHSYFPILVQEEFPINRDELYNLLKSENIYGRRYFYPLITEFPMYKGLPSSHPNNVPTATAISQRVLCLPIHPNLTEEDQLRVVSVLASV